MEVLNREEALLNSIAEGEETTLEPRTRYETFLASIAKGEEITLKPKTRQEWFLKEISKNAESGGGSITLQDKTFTENGTYTADEGYDGLGNVTVNVESSGGGDASQLDALIDGSLTELTSNATKIRSYTFYRNNALLRATLENATTEVSTTNAFTQCTNLVEVSIPKVVVIGSEFFANCTSLTDVNMPNLEEASFRSFNYCSSLKHANFPKLEKIGREAFAQCSSLEKIEYNNMWLREIPDQCFSSCINLGGSYRFDNVKSIGLSGFYRTKIQSIDLTKCTLLGNYSLSSECLDTLILRGNSICSMNNINTLADTLIANGTGYIYVPSALVDSYKTSTNWSTYASQFRALEDYTVDGTITGELDETKI